MSGRIIMKVFWLYPVFVLLAGCSWFNLLDTNPEPSKNSYKFKAEKRSLAYTYMGKTQGEVLADWGKPEFVELNASYCTKSFGGDCMCVKDKCGADIAYADEKWRYTAKDRLGLVEWMHYSVDFYFKDNMVIKTQ